MAQGYDRFQYETSPRKLEPEYIPVKKKAKQMDPKKKEIHKKAKENVKLKKQAVRKKKKVIAYICIAFAIVLAISYRNSLINENFAKVKTLKTELSNIEKENEQLQVAIESSTNLNNVEQAAKERLGMQKLTNGQKVYINLPKKDYVEPATEQVVLVGQQNWFSQLLGKLKGEK